MAPPVQSFQVLSGGLRLKPQAPATAEGEGGCRSTATRPKRLRQQPNGSWARHGRTMLRMDAKDDNREWGDARIPPHHLFVNHLSVRPI